jgi:(2Fe-2S) ferredoxin
MVIYPNGDWYGEVDTDKIDHILNALEDGTSADELAL